MSRSTIGTLVDRRTGYLRLVHLPDGHGAEQLRVAMAPVLTGMPALGGQTLTWDQGSEMACHDQLAEYFADGIFFAHPAVRGCAARTRTPTACSASASPRAATCARSPSPTYGRSSSASTSDRGSASAGAVRHRRWRQNWHPDAVIVATTARVHPLNPPVARGSVFRRRRQSARSRPGRRGCWLSACGIPCSSVWAARRAATATGPSPRRPRGPPSAR